MPDFRRRYTPGGTWFFTVVLRDRRSRLLVEHIDALRDAIGWTLRHYPFRINAFVVLPEHLHAIWTLPPEDTDFSTRWRMIKTRFVRSLPATEALTRTMVERGERGIWQRRFWEHRIRDDQEIGRYASYCAINPVKHGLVRRAIDWPYSSFHRDVRRGLYDEDWGTAVEFHGDPASKAP
jgi:putative transposase